jgi:glucose dehydrogenase
MLQKLLLLAAAIAMITLASAQTGRVVDDATLRNAAKNGDDWTSYGFTPGETRYSPLQQINTSNVSRLGLAWSYDVGRGGGNQEATPLAWNGAVYGITNWSIVFALDARTGKDVFSFPDGAFNPVVCDQTTIYLTGYSTLYQLLPRR